MINRLRLCYLENMQPRRTIWHGDCHCSVQFAARMVGHIKNPRRREKAERVMTMKKRDWSAMLVTVICLCLFSGTAATAAPLYMWELYGFNGSNQDYRGEVQTPDNRVEAIRGAWATRDGYLNLLNTAVPGIDNPPVEGVLKIVTSQVQYFQAGSKVSLKLRYQAAQAQAKTAGKPAAPEIPGARACVISRSFDSMFLLGACRTFRDWLLGGAPGRYAVGLYYENEGGALR